MAAGDTVRVAAGTYAERVTVAASKSGSVPTPTRFIADGTVTVTGGFVVNSSYTELSGFTIKGGQSLSGERSGQIDIAGDYNTVSGVTVEDIDRGAGISLRTGASYNVIEDFEVDGVATYGITTSDTYNTGSDHTTIRNGTITGHRGWAGIELTGDDHVVESVTISGPSGSRSPVLDGDGIRVNYSKRSTIKDCVIAEIWEMYHEDQHTDAIQLWTNVEDLVIDSCIIGTWQPGGHQNELGPTQGIMAGTVPAGARIGFTVKNSLFLGTGQKDGVAINTARASGASIDLTLLNNTFWSARPQLNSVSKAYVRNNVFRDFYLYPVNMSGIDSDYNAFCWAAGQGQSNVPASEGSHSLGKTYETRVDPAFVAPDITAAGNWGVGADFRPKTTSPLVRAGEAASAPATDFSGARRNNPPCIGAFEHTAAKPTPTPDPDPKPNPDPTPDPDPKPNPDPTPDPDPNPDPDPKPNPNPDPTPDPVKPSDASVERIWGANRYAGAVAIARDTYDADLDRSGTQWGSLRHVVIASGEDRSASDPLAAAGLCGVYDAPLLLVSSTSVPAVVKEAVREIADQASGQVAIHIVGGTVPVPDARYNELAAYVGASKLVKDRITSKGDRYDMAAAIAQRIQNETGRRPRAVLVANGADPSTFTDALSLAPLAMAKGYPLLLVKQNQVPDVTAQTIAQIRAAGGAKDGVYIAGGTLTVSENVRSSLGASRWAGENRYGTAAAIASGSVSKGWLDPSEIGLAAKLPDALAGGPSVGRRDGVLLLTASTGLSGETVAWLRANSPSDATLKIFGGTAVISRGVEGSVSELL